MPVEKVVINASPLILLFNSDLAFILPGLFNEIVVPEAVWQEVIDTPTKDKAGQMISQVDWLKQVPVKTIEEVITWDLGRGETEVLSFALRHKDYRPMLDDSAGKKCAVSLGLPTLGTGSILILAKEKGLIDSVEKSLLNLRSAGMWISDSTGQLHLL
jgi:predicted nucleic acid-binding protein